MRDVKSRAYNSPRRAEQALATRRAVLDAARVCFAQGGYAATSIEAVARAAGVSAQTIYATFRTKPALVVELLQLVKDDAAVAETYRALMASTDAREQLALSAAITRRFSERGGDVLDVVVATRDPEVVAAWREVEERRRRGQGALVASIAARGELRVPPEEAADVLWALSSHDMWRLLVGARGWTPDAFEAWLTRATCEMLLP